MWYGKGHLSGKGGSKAAEDDGPPRQHNHPGLDFNPMINDL